MQEQANKKARQRCLLLVYPTRHILGTRGLHWNSSELYLQLKNQVATNPKYDCYESPSAFSRQSRTERWHGSSQPCSGTQGPRMHNVRYPRPSKVMVP